MELAPIVLFVYNRPHHTKRVLDALKNNDHADESTLIIFSDGEKEESDTEESELVDEVRSIIHNINWCKDLIMHENPTNLGLARSIVQGMGKTFESYDKAIVLEDDIITSRFFLKTFNQALEIYKDSNRVYTISGYIEPIKIKPPKYFFLTKGTSWGWATWKHRWSDLILDVDFLIQFIEEYDLRKTFNFSGYPYFQMLNDQKDGSIDSWAILFYASCFIKGGLHLTFNPSLTTNIGFDGSGIHCRKDLIINNLDISETEINIEKIPEIPNHVIPALVQKWRKKSYKPGFSQRLLSKFKIK